MKASNLKYPALCEPELEEEAGKLNPNERRNLARRFEHWAAQLLFSAELVERFEGQPGLSAPTEIPDWAQKRLRDAAELERIAGEMRKVVLGKLGVKLPAQPAPALPEVARQN